MSAARGRDGADRPRKSTDRFSTALYSTLLLTFPADFRRLHGRDAVELFHDRLRDARRGGLRRVATFWARNVVDAVGQGLSERRARPHVPRPSAPRAPQRPRRRPRFEQLLTGLRLTARNLARSPVYSLFVIVVFALTILAVTTVSSAMESLLWRPMPFPEPQRLVFVGERSADADDGPAYVTSTYVLDAIRREVSSLEGLAIFNIWEATLTGAGDPRRLGGAAVSWNYFETLGVPPTVGRSFVPDDVVPGAEPVVIISHGLWRGRFGADPGVIGRVIELNGEGATVVGVMPAGFETPDQYTFTRSAPDVWRPAFRLAPDELGEPGSNYLRGVARLAPGADLEHVDAQLAALRTRIGEEFPRWAEGSRITALPLKHQFTAELRPVLWILAGAVGVVLLIGSVNVMTLILSRTIDRAHEFAVRTALGAGRGHLLAHAVLEALLLAVPGGVLGLLAAHWAIGLLVSTASSSGVARIGSLGIGPLTVAIAVSLTFAAALVAGLVPGLRLLRRATGGGSNLRTREGAGAGSLAHSTLAVVQLALAVMLLVAAGLLLRSFQQLLRIDPGFDPTDVYVAQLDLPPGRYEDIAARTALTDRLTVNLEALADVRAAGFVTTVPQHGHNNFSTGFGIAGREQDPDAPTWAYFRGASPGYFEAADLRLRRGRLLEAQDFKDGVPTGVVINEELEGRYFGGESAMGATLEVLGQPLEVVGVVADVQYGWFGNDPQPETYAPWQGRMFTVFLVVKAEGVGGDIPALMKHEVQALDPYLPMDEVWRLEDLTGDSLAPIWMPLLLMATLAGFAVLLSAMGTYGVITHMVARRTSEIGVRMALGARTWTVLAMVVGRVLRIAATGALIGLALAWAGARFLESLLYGVEARDPLTFVAVAIFLLAAALLACLQPARRAVRVDPVIALRHE